jgi:hypothetical protein
MTDDRPPRPATRRRRRGLAVLVSLTLPLAVGTGVAIAAWTDTTQLTATASADYLVPVVQLVPHINGTAVDTAVLTAVPGTWVNNLSPSATVSNQWYQCSLTLTGCTAISGATGSTYTVPAGGAAANRYVLQETVTNGTKTTTAVSIPTELQSPGALLGLVPFTAVATVMPTISGTFKVGSTATADPGTWQAQDLLGVVISVISGSSNTYQWLRCGPIGNTGNPTVGTAGCTTISGATNATYTVTGADLGQRLRVQVVHTTTVLLNLSAAVNRVDTQASAVVTTP